MLPRRSNEVSRVKAPKALLSLSLVAATSLTSCGTLNRAGKDVFLGIGTPVLMLYGGATDGYASAKAVRTGMDANAGIEVLFFPFTFIWYAIEHGVCGIVHIIDFCFTPFYGLAELHPAGPDIKPLDFYQGTWFDSWAEDKDDKKEGTDAESGQPANGG